MTGFIGRLIMLCVVAAIAVGVAASVAGATKPARGCTKWYTLPPATTANDFAADKNGDGVICVNQVATGNGSDGHLNVVDNTTNS